MQEGNNQIPPFARVWHQMFNYGVKNFFQLITFAS